MFLLALLATVASLFVFIAGIDDPMVAIPSIVAYFASGISFFHLVHAPDDTEDWKDLFLNRGTTIFKHEAKIAQLQEHINGLYDDLVDAYTTNFDLEDKIADMKEGMKALIYEDEVEEDVAAEEEELFELTPAGRDYLDSQVVAKDKVPEALEEAGVFLSRHDVLGKAAISNRIISPITIDPKDVYEIVMK